MDIKLKSLTMFNIIQKINFELLSHYVLNEDCIFKPTNNTSLIIKELIKITKILDEQNISYNVDENFNIIIKTYK